MSICYHFLITIIFRNNQHLQSILFNNYKPFQVLTPIYNYQQHIILQIHLSIFQVKNIIILNLIFEMSSSGFSYNWGNLISVLNSIDSIISYKYSSCDLYNMGYISASKFHFSIGLPKCIQTCTNILEK